MSEATHAAAAPVASKLPMVAVAVVLAVCLQRKTVADWVVMSAQSQFHPAAAVGSPTIPADAVPPYRQRPEP